MKYAIIIVMGFILSCKIIKHKSEKTQSGLNINCNYLGHECDSLLNCYTNYFVRYPEFGDSIPSKMDILEVEACMANKMRNGDKFSLHVLLKYYKLQFEKKGADVLLYYDFNNTFGGFVDQEVFDLALLYASKTKCHSSGNDVLWEGDGNIALNVIEHVINPMIKSVGGEGTMGMYLYVDNYKNRSVKPTATDQCQWEHQFTYGELLKAYNEGKIVLKKYGEE